MIFNEVIGNKELINKLKGMVDENRVSHALLFIESEGQGALPMIVSMIQYMNCKNRNYQDSCSSCHSCHKIDKLIHPDLHLIFPVSNTSKSSSDRKPISDMFLKQFRELYYKNPYFSEDDLNKALGIEEKIGAISVFEAKEIVSKMSLKSYEGGNKYMIILLPEKMSVEASNKLLKLIEEPTPGTFFFLISHAPDKIISTIRSRCLPVQLRPTEVNDLAIALSAQYNLSSEASLAFARNSGGNYGKAVEEILAAGEQSPFTDIAFRILNYCINSDLESLLTLSTDLAALGREKQKSFFLYFENYLRKCFIIESKLTDISYANEEEKRSISAFIGKFTSSFYESAFEFVDTSRAEIESNVNAKMVFCNLFNKLYILNKKITKK